MTEPVLRWLALLRGINVGGHNKVPMAELRTMFEGLGYTDVVTYIQTGNVWFSAPHVEAAALEAALAIAFGFPIPALVFPQPEFDAIAIGNPFAREPGLESAHLHVTFLSQIPSDAAMQALAAVPASRERFILAGRALYLHFPDGYGRAKLENNFLGRTLGVVTTTRNWKTVSALHALV